MQINYIASTSSRVGPGQFGGREPTHAPTSPQLARPHHHAHAATRTRRRGEATPLSPVLSLPSGLPLHLGFPLLPKQGAVTACARATKAGGTSPPPAADLAPSPGFDARSAPAFRRPPGWVGSAAARRLHHGVSP